MSESITHSGPGGQPVLASPLAGIAAAFTSRTLVFRFDPAVAIAPLPGDNPADQWLIADRENIDRYFTHQPQRNRFLGFLRSGSQGIFLVRDAEWIAHVWCVRPGGHPPHLPRSAGRLGAWWLFYGHTRERYRGHGLYKRILRRAVQLIRAQDSNAVILGDTIIDNTPSQRALLHTGFLPSGIFLTRRLSVPRLGSLPLFGRWERTAPHPAPGGDIPLSTPSGANIFPTH